jgi:hypothetical protein
MTSIQLINMNNDFFEIDIPILRKIIDIARSTNGAVYNSESKRWSIPYREYNDFLQAILPFGAITEKNIEDYEKIPSSQKRLTFEQASRPTTIKLKIDDGLLKVKLYGFNKEAFDFLNQIPGRKFDCERKVFIYDASQENFIRSKLNCFSNLYIY